MPWLIISTLGDTPTGILACAGLLLGVLIMARGARGGARERPAPVAAPAEAPAAAAPVTAAPAATVAVPALPVADVPAGPPPTTFRQGAIRLGGAPAPEPEAVAAPEPAAVPEPVAAPEPAPPVPPPVPQTPPTTFRQGSIRVGGVERRRD